MQINTQPIEKSTNSSDLEVFEIFDTLQGEGPFAGTPATFIRLAGCNLRCNFCDSLYSSRRDTYTPKLLLNHLLENYPKRELVVITGGEPFRQDIMPFVSMLFFEDYIVQIETNGTLWLPSLDTIDVIRKVNLEDFVIVCSPKTPAIHEKMWPWITELKYVVEAGKISMCDGLPISSVGPQYGIPARPPKDWSGQIYIQPLDSQDPVENEANMQAAVRSCLKFGHRLCLQLQKIVSLP